MEMENVGGGFAVGRLGLAIQPINSWKKWTLMGSRVRALIHGSTGPLLFSFDGILSAHSTTVPLTTDRKVAVKPCHSILILIKKRPQRMKRMKESNVI
jgi:hypothetical protein